MLSGNAHHTSLRQFHMTAGGVALPPVKFDLMSFNVRFLLIIFKDARNIMQWIEGRETRRLMKSPLHPPNTSLEYSRQNDVKLSLCISKSHIIKKFGKVQDR